VGLVDVGQGGLLRVAQGREVHPIKVLIPFFSKSLLSSLLGLPLFLFFLLSLNSLLLVLVGLLLSCLLGLPLFLFFLLSLNSLFFLFMCPSGLFLSNLFGDDIFSQRRLSSKLQRVRQPSSPD